MPVRSRWRRMCVESKFGEARMSASLKSTIAPRAAMMPALRAAARPLYAPGRCRTVGCAAWSSARYSAVPSVEFESQTSSSYCRDGKILRQKRRQDVRQRVEPVVRGNDDGDFRHQQFTSRATPPTISSRKARDRSGVCPRRLSNEDVRNAVRRPLLRVQPEIAVFERNDRRSSDGAGDVRRACVDGYHDSTALENRRPLVKGQATQEACNAIAAFECRRTARNPAHT